MDDATKKALRGRAHGLEPYITIGAGGVHEGTIDELHRALLAHELVKVRFTTADRKERKAQIPELARQTESAVVLSIGKVASYYRPKPPPTAEDA
jgi:RNA-binding protein